MTDAARAMYAEPDSIHGVNALCGGEDFHRLLELIPAGAYTCDAEGKITFFNRRARELWGRTPALNSAENRFCGAVRLFASDGTAVAHDACWMALALRNDREYDGEELVIERPDGSRVTTLIHATPFHDGAGKVAGGVNLVVDITNRKRAEKALKEADRQKDELLAALAHELRNPLAPIRNALQLLRIDGDNPATLRQARTMMERQLHQLVRVVDAMTDVSRISRNAFALEKERIALAEVLRSAVSVARPLVDAGDHELVVTLPTAAVELEGDPARLTQVFATLLDNAAKYTERGGRIWLTAARDGTDVVVRVKDTGVGISADMLARVFDVFAQVDQSLERAQGGLGIALSLARGLVGLHGGSITAKSEGPGRGSEFAVRLPVLPAAPQAVLAEATPPKPAATAARRRILVVDDNKDAAFSLGMILRIMGNEVRSAHDGLDAVEMAEQFRPDVVLLDIGLPRLNGYDAARRIRAESWGWDMHLIAITGFGQDAAKRRATESGFDSHMVKPVDPAVLASTLAGLRRMQA